MPPNKADLISDPQEDGFQYVITDDDGVVWWAVPSEQPSAFVEWQRRDELNALQ